MGGGSDGGPGKPGEGTVTDGPTLDKEIHPAPWDTLGSL